MDSDAPAWATDPLFTGGPDSGGEMGRSMAVHDWSATPLGPPDTWSPSLRSVVRILLTSRFSMWMGWGPELVVLYNDAYRRDTLRTKHPWALGRPAREVWAEIWPDIGPRIQSVIDTGEATWDEGLLLFLERSGYPEETYHTFSYSPLGDEGGRVAGFLCVVSEDTERMLGERRLRILSELGEISAAGLTSTVASACGTALSVLARGHLDVPFAAVYLVDPDGAGLRRAAFFGTLDDPRPVPERIDRAAPGGASTVWEALDTGRPRTRTGLASEFGGLFVPVGPPMGDLDPDALMVQPLPGGGGRTAGVLLAGVSPFRALDEEYRRFLGLVAGQVGKAITDAQTYQDQRRRTEELTELDRAKTEFFTGVSHELRTPLTLIAGPAEDGLADLHEPLPPGQRARMEIISRNAGRLRRLVDTMLDFARLERGGLTPDPTPVDLAALTRGIAESFAPAVVRARLDYTIDCPDLGSTVGVDVDMWEKIVLNLLSNAVKYTLDGRVGLGLRRVGDGVQLAVTDTGIGIAAADVPMLFRRFHRVRGAAGRSHEGSGIGLALVAELTGLHGGQVTVDSAPGRGSTFTVRLPGSLLTGEPAVPPAASTSAPRYREEALQWSAATPASRPTTGPAAPTVLVAEDNPDLRQFLAHLLAPLYTVVLAPDGHAALAAIRDAAPDLVLTDVMMPGLDGFALLAAMRADPATATIPVIMLSARAGEEAAIEGLGAGADDYVVKPFSSHDLLARVRSNLALSRLRNHEASWRRALVGALQDGFYVLDEDNTVVEVNDAFESVLGYGADGLPYRTPHPWFPAPEVDPDTTARLEKVLAGTGGGRFVGRVVHRDGHRVWVETLFSTATDPSTGRRVRVGTVRDVTEARRAELATALLAEIGGLAAQGGTSATLLGEVLGAAARVVPDAVVLSLRRPDGTFAPSMAADPTDPGGGSRLLAREPFRLPEHVAARFRSGHPIGVTSEDLDPRPWAPLGAGSALVVPVAARGMLFATLTFVSAATHRYDAAEHALAAEVGRRVARMIDTDRAATRDRLGRRLTTALASASSVEEAARVLVPMIVEALGASAGAVLIQRPGRALERVHEVGRARHPGFDPGRAGTAHPVTDCSRTATAVWLRDDTDRAAAYPELRGGAELPGFVALPLVVGTRPVGVLAIGFATRREFDADERAFAMELAAEAGLAVERGALADVRREVVDTLQRSLLPAALPALRRLDLAAHYTPAAWGSKAGGDWYDVLELDDGLVAIVVGDVVGQGPGAAAVMGQLRSALAAYLLHERSPAVALGLLDRFARRIEGARGSSAVCLVLDTGRGTLRWASAGHPPPLVLDADGARYLRDAHGCVLGVSGAPPLTEVHDALAPGSTVLLYTDGLIERRNEVIDDGLDRLAAAALASAADPPAVLIPAVLRRALDGAGPADDVAVVVARLRPAPLHRELPAVAARLSGVRAAVRRWAAAAALPTEQLDDLQFALGEALANAVEHAYPDGEPGPMSFDLEITEHGDVDVVVADQGTWRPPPDDPGYRGRGLAMIHRLADAVTVDTESGGTRIRFTVPVPTP